MVQLPSSVQFMQDAEKAEVLWNVYHASAKLPANKAFRRSRLTDGDADVIFFFNDFCSDLALPRRLLSLPLGHHRSGSCRESRARVATTT